MTKKTFILVGLFLSLITASPVLARPGPSISVSCIFSGEYALVEYRFLDPELPLPKEDIVSIAHELRQELRVKRLRIIVLNDLPAGDGTLRAYGMIDGLTDSLEFVDSNIQKQSPTQDELLRQDFENREYRVAYPSDKRKGNSIHFKINKPVVIDENDGSVMVWETGAHINRKQVCLRLEKNNDPALAILSWTSSVGSLITKADYIIVRGVLSSTSAKSQLLESGNILGIFFSNVDMHRVYALADGNMLKKDSLRLEEP